MTRSFLYLATFVFSLAMSGCGGGGDGGGAGFAAYLPPNAGAAPPPASNSAALSGTAATGLPITGASVSIRCANGTRAQTATDDEGRWQTELETSAYPCVVTVSGGSLALNEKFHSLAVAKGHVNVTPLTELVLAKALRSAPSKLEDADSEVFSLLVSRLSVAQDEIMAILREAGFPTLAIDVFSADFSPIKGDPYDDLLERLAISLADGARSYQDFVESVASMAPNETIPLPNTLVLAAADLSKMPQINRGSISTEGGLLTMALAAGGNPVGGFVGGGTGNKAVLQLGGLAGTKLKDLDAVEIEMKGDAAGVTASSSTAPYVYLNLTIDLECRGQAVDQSATLAQVSARRRILTFDTFYEFIQRSPALSSTEMRTIMITPRTPGWRASAGIPIGTVPIGGNYSGNETLEGFDFASYPDACIVDGATGDAGLGRSKEEPVCDTAFALSGADPAKCSIPYSGGILVLGSSGTTDASMWQVHRVSVLAKQRRTFRFE